MKKYPLIGALAALVLLAGCRGMETDNEPIHLNRNMDFQPRYDAQEKNTFFEDEMAMRPPVPGTVAKGFLREDVRFYSGQTEEGRFVSKVPVPVTQALLERGRERYNIFCSVCHGQAGFGQGVIMTGSYGYTPAPTYHRAALRDTSDGYLYNVITNGVRNMPGYAAQIPVADRWAIVSYIRALQRSQNAQRENVPPSVLARIEQTGSANMNAARNPAGPSSSGGTSTGGATDGASGTGDSGESGSTAPADTASAQPTAGAAEPASSDTANATTADAMSASTDTTEGAGTAGGTAGMDTSSTATVVAEDATGGDTDESGNAADTTGAGEASSSGGSFFGSTFFVIALVVLPIAALTGMLVVAFRKDRDH